MPQEVFVQQIKTPLGIFEAQATAEGIVRLRFPNHFPRRAIRTKAPAKPKAHLASCALFLKRFFSRHGALRGKVPIDWSGFGNFDQQVLKRLRAMRPGSVVTYGRLARLSGKPGAARAVGNVLKRNPVPILIPCHRVIRSDRSLGGFQGGVRWKRTLLDCEARSSS